VAGSPSAARPSSNLSLPPPRPHESWSGPELSPPVSGSGPKLAPPPVPGSGPKAAPPPVPGSGPKLAPPPVPGSGPKAAAAARSWLRPQGSAVRSWPRRQACAGWRLRLGTGAAAGCCLRDSARWAVAEAGQPCRLDAFKPGASLAGLDAFKPGASFAFRPARVGGRTRQGAAPRLEKRPSRAQSVAALGTHLPKSARRTVAQRHRLLKYVVAAGAVVVLGVFVISFSWRERVEKLPLPPLFWRVRRVPRRPHPCAKLRRHRRPHPCAKLDATAGPILA